GHRRHPARRHRRPRRRLVGRQRSPPARPRNRRLGLFLGLPRRPRQRLLPRRPTLPARRGGSAGQRGVALAPEPQRPADHRVVHPHHPPPARQRVKPEALPVLVVGDVHGDLERLFAALKSYPATDYRTIFLGDLVDGGPFGVGALRYARDRANSEVLVGNHEVLMLWALRDRSRLSFWASNGGELHDLKELEGDPGLQGWLRKRPALLKLEDGTLVQHSDNDFYGKLLEPGVANPVETINRETGRLLASGEEAALWDILTPGRVFRKSRQRLERWLETM